MSRIGKLPIILPQGVTAELKDGIVTIKGAKGTLSTKVGYGARVVINDGVINIGVQKPELPKQAALWGTTRSIIQNLVTGVTEGFSKQIEINGVGYKAAMKGKDLVLNVGFSHPKEYNVPEGIVVEVDKNVISISGIDKHKVGQVASEIRAVRSVEPYKGKGMKYVGEYVRRKAGKTATKGE